MKTYITIEEFKQLLKQYDKLADGKGIPKWATHVAQDENGDVCVFDSSNATLRPPHPNDSEGNGKSWVRRTGTKRETLFTMPFKVEGWNEKVFLINSEGEE